MSSKNINNINKVAQYKSDVKSQATKTGQILSGEQIFTRSCGLNNGHIRAFIFTGMSDTKQSEDILEKIIADLSNTRDPIILSELNFYPIMSVKAHTRPFERRWLNIVSAVVVPVGLFLYLRMWMFRVRLYRDLRTVQQTSEKIIARIDKLRAEDAAKAK